MNVQLKVPCNCASFYLGIFFKCRFVQDRASLVWQCLDKLINGWCKIQVKVDATYTQRSKITGNLLVTFPRVTPDRRRSYVSTTPAVPHLTSSKTSTKKLGNKVLGKGHDKTNELDVVDIHNIVHGHDRAPPTVQVQEV